MLSGLFNPSISELVLVMFLLFCYCCEQAVDIKLLNSLTREDLKKICGDNFPEWISFPEFEQVWTLLCSFSHWVRTDKYLWWISDGA